MADLFLYTLGPPLLVVALSAPWVLRAGKSDPGLVWRLAFIIGMVTAPLIWQLFAPLPAMQMPSNSVLIIVAGLLVGFGTRLGSGCTSGHGVCGLSRLSLRSLAATLTFIATGAITVFVMRHVIG